MLNLETKIHPAAEGEQADGRIGLGLAKRDLVGVLEKYREI